LPDERKPVPLQPLEREMPTMAASGGELSGVRLTVRCEVVEGIEQMLLPEAASSVASAPLRESTPPRSRFSDWGEIARGGMGRVWRVFDKVLLRELAMKVIEPAASAQPDVALRFLEEAQITGQLDHPNIVPIHDIGVDQGDNCSFITMKLVEGKTLTHLIDEIHDKPSSRGELERILQVCLKVCDAVAFAHSRGVVHRDLKPDNIMVGTHGQVYVMDWGVALLLCGQRPSETQERESRITVQSGSTGQSGAGSIIGTVDFMAPEQARGLISVIDERTDVFGLGGLLYFLLTGRGPNTADSPTGALQKARAGAVTPPQDHAAWPDLPPGLCAIAMKALARTPADRYANVAELRNDLEQFLRGGGWFNEVTFAPGVTIVKEGDVADCAYIIVQGRCRVMKRTGEAETVMRELGPGEVFGETAVLTRGPRTASVVAIDEVTLKVVTRETLEAELERNPWLGSFVRAMAARFRDIDDRLAQLGVPRVG
jgi:eukaryotic-like serine/threonine-protein kinase